MVDRKLIGPTLWRYKNLFFIIVPILATLPLPIVVKGKESQCGYVMILMAILWCTEALPLAVTALIPVFIMPLLGLLKEGDIVILYMQETTMMFAGGLMVALAIEKCNLHRRIALGILQLVGVKPIWLMMGFMLPTWFLSMWISNTATTSMMLPILEAVLEKLGTVAHGKKDESNDENAEEGHDNLAMSEITIATDEETAYIAVGDEEEASTSSSGQSRDQDNNDNELTTDKQPNGTAAGNDIETLKKPPVYVIGDQCLSEPKGKSFKLKAKKASRKAPQYEEDDDMQDNRTPQEIKRDVARFDKLAKGMTLAVAYSANVGGTATLTGTTPNIVMKNAADDLWAEKGLGESPVNFASYMVFSAPSAFITVILIWLWMSIYFLGPKGYRVCCGGSSNKNLDKLIEAEIKKDYVALGKMRYAEWWVLLIFVSMILLWFFRSPGFLEGWGDIHYPGYSKDSVVSIMCTVVCFIIPSQPFSWGSRKEKGPVDTLLDWDMIHHKFPWGVIFLVGGGMALAEAATESGLSAVIGDALTVFDVLPQWFMAFVLAFFTSLLTEVTSNTATCTLMMPIMSTMAESLNLNPLYLMFPCAVATSYAFMLPVSTPPNAIAFSYNRITVLDMVKAGALLKLTVFVITLATESWGMIYFDFKTLPWALNETLINDTMSMGNSHTFQMIQATVRSKMTLLD